MRTLENSSLPHSEMAFAFIASAKADTGSFALKLANTVRMGVATVRANWSVWPKHALDIVEGGLLILKTRFVERWIGHGSFPLRPRHYHRRFIMSSVMSP